MIARTDRLLALILAAIFIASGAFAENAPTLLNFQGRLTNTGGAPVTAPTAVRFTMYQGGTATENPSTGTMVYQEDATVTPDGNGVFSTVIGRGTPVGGQTLTPSDFNTNGLPLYIEMSIGGSVLLPRTQVISAGFSVESSRLGGLSAQDIIGQSGGNAFVNQVVRNGAGLEWLSVSQINIKPGTLGFPDGKVRKTTVTLTWSFANPTGPLGLDTGSEAASTWYFLYAIPDPMDDTRFSVIGSIQTPTEIGGAGPSGYAVSRYVGAIRNDASSNIQRFHQSKNRFYWTVLSYLEFNGGHADYTLHDITLTYVPATASAGFFFAQLNKYGQPANWNVHQSFYVRGETAYYFEQDLVRIDYDVDDASFEMPLPGQAPKVVRHSSSTDNNANQIGGQLLYTTGWEDGAL